jgi:hypothetical protein
LCNFSGYDANLVMIGSGYVNSKVLAQGGRLDVDTIPQGSNLIEVKFKRISKEAIEHKGRT